MERHESHEKNRVANHDREPLEIVRNKELPAHSEDYLNAVIDNICLGIVFDIHRKFKTNNLQFTDEESRAVSEENPYTDIFGQHNLKKTQDCLCPNCDRLVAATRFAPHLEACMGMGRSRARNASRRIASNSSSKERENTSSYGNTGSDDEDDSDWNWGDKRRKKKDKNGNKKKSAIKKTNESECVDAMNVDIEGEDDYLSNLRDLLQEHSNGSPVDASSKKKEKSKNKKSSRKDRSSPNASFNLD